MRTKTTGKQQLAVSITMLACIVAIALFGGCNPYIDQLQACYGKNRRTMEMYWGKPTYCEQDGSYGTVCIYTADGYFTEKRFYFDNTGTIYLIKTR